MKKLFNIDFLAVWKKEDHAYIAMESQDAIDLDILMRDNELEFFKVFNDIYIYKNKVITQFNLTIYQLIDLNKTKNKVIQKPIHVDEMKNILEICL